MRTLEIRTGDRHVSTNRFYSALVVNLLVGFAATLKGVDPLALLRVECGDDGCRLSCDERPVEMKPFVESLLSDIVMAVALRLQDVDPNEEITFVIGPETDEGFEDLEISHDR